MPFSDSRNQAVQSTRPATFYVLSAATAPALNKSMLSLAVSAGSSRKVTLRDIFIVNTQTAAIVGVNTEFQLFRFATHTVGSLLTAVAYDTLDSLSGTVTCRTGATIAGEVATPLRQWYLCGDESVAGAATNQGVQLYSQFAPALGLANYKQPIIRGGEGLHIKCITNIAVGQWGIGVVFTEDDA